MHGRKMKIRTQRTQLLGAENNMNVRGCESRAQQTNKHTKVTLGRYLTVFRGCPSALDSSNIRFPENPIADLIR